MPDIENNQSSLWARFLAMPNDRPIKTLIVTLAVAFTGAVLVATSAVVLKPLQIINKELDRRQHIEDMVRNLPGGGAGIVIEPRVVDLATGEYLPDIDATQFDQRRATISPDESIEITPENDIANLSRRSRKAVVYVGRRDGKVELAILPVRGQGYGSMLYGYLGLAADANTVIGLSFYEHSETPGLGALIDTDDWKQQWQGKLVHDGGVVRLGIGSRRIKAGSEEEAYQGDALTGATWTGLGVNNLLHYWLGPDGFGPYLAKLGKRGG